LVFASAGQLPGALLALSTMPLGASAGSVSRFSIAALMAARLASGESGGCLD